MEFVYIDTFAYNIEAQWVSHQTTDTNPEFDYMHISTFQSFQLSYNDTETAYVFLKYLLLLQNWQIDGKDLLYFAIWIWIVSFLAKNLKWLTFPYDGSWKVWTPIYSNVLFRTIKIGISPRMQFNMWLLSSFLSDGKVFQDRFFTIPNWLAFLRI